MVSGAGADEGHCPYFYQHIASTYLSRANSLLSASYTPTSTSTFKTCQSSHSQPLVPAYTGSQDHPDWRIFGMFRLYLQTHTVLVADKADKTHLQVWTRIRSSDVPCVLRVREGDRGPSRRAVHCGTGALASDIPKSINERVTFFRAVLRYSARQVRAVEPPELASECLSAHEYEQYAGSHYTRLPASTVLLAHAMRAIPFPANFIQPLTSRFFLQMLELDTSDALSLSPANGSASARGR
ncbi:unnamed protein product [Peniophora sp. CBMAI 1063]|nr:unnamed protein product [Peniophora sp. CBMAI 1063]